jgi:murein DD-endopeptidase MepM/ murein hydrolase activator NlpD
MGVSKLEHGSYLSRIYHMDVINVTMGQTIKKGQKIGVIGGRGSTGINQ